MTNPYYNGGSFPATGAPATSASMRAELSAITAGFDKLPVLSGNANKLVVVNSSASALEVTTALPPITIADTSLIVEDNGDNTRRFRFEANVITPGATRVLTVPDADLTLVGTTATQTLTNKTLNLASNTLVATSAQIAAAVTDETGSGALVFGTNPTISGATLTGGSLNNTPIGGSTPNTGAFTTLSSTGNTTLGDAVGDLVTVNGTTTFANANPTLSAGTANGVLYLNGSKVATSGSALTFDGTNLAVGVSSPGAPIGVQANASALGLRVIGRSTGDLGYINFRNNANSSDLVTLGGQPAGFSVDIAGTEGMRLTSTGLGVGLTAASRFDAGQSGGSRIRFDLSSASNAAVNYSNYAGSAFLDATHNAVNHIWTNAGAELARLTSKGLLVGYTSDASLTGSGNAIFSGNLGIGTSSPATKLHVDTGAAGYGITVAALSQTIRTYQFGVDSNSNFAIYDSTAAAQRVVLDQSGNLGLGVTPSAVSVSDKVVQVGAFLFNNNTNGYGILRYNNFFNGTNDVYYANGSASAFQMQGNAFKWYTAPSGTAGNAISFTQAMTLDASGRLLVGVTSGSYALDVGDVSGGNMFRFTRSGVELSAFITAGVPFIGSTTNNALALMTNNTECARITSGGNLLVGTTSNFGANVRTYLVATTGGNALITQTDTAASFVEAVWNQGTSGDNKFTEFGTEATYTGRGSITYNRAGGLVAYNTTSDYRAKDIIGPVQDPGATIDALKVYEGVMKGATQSRPMLVAHEAQAVAPYAVSGVKDEVNEDGTPKFQQMDVSSLVPLLLAEIQSLRARVAALEGV